MYRGRYQVGDYVPLFVLCTDANGVPTPPDSVPRARVFGPAGAPAVDVDLPAIDRYVTAGLFSFALSLGSSFLPVPIGNYRVVYTYSLGTYTGLVEDSFEVVDGGNSAGNILSAYYYRTPNTDYLVYQTDNGQNIGGHSVEGRILAGRNPRI